MLEGGNAGYENLNLRSQTLAHVHLGMVRRGNRGQGGQELAGDRAKARPADVVRGFSPRWPSVFIIPQVQINELHSNFVTN